MNTHNYRAFLLRLWREDDGDSWRATLEDPHTGERFGFAALEQLFAFLKEVEVERLAPDPARDDD